MSLLSPFFASLLAPLVGVPATGDPYPPVPLVVPSALLVNITGALAFIVSVVPYPAAALAYPSTLDEYESGTNIHMDHAWGRWFFFDLDNGHWRSHVAARCDHASRCAN